jgi:hypothetical protein
MLMHVFVSIRNVGRMAMAAKFVQVALVTFISMLGLCATVSGQTRSFVVFDRKSLATIVYDTADYPTVKLAAQLLAQDIERLTGEMPAIKNDFSGLKGNVIMVGSVDRSSFMQHHLIKEQINVAGIEGKWETYLIRVLEKPTPEISNAMVICGSDKRGTAYGVFDLSQRMGLSPWYWWADVTPQRTNKLAVPFLNVVSNPPSVKYRGIFINDEDWGLQPWAAKTFEPETGDIGPKTYARIFELLLRLKANMIWPAMHPSTKAFYFYPQNKVVADEYGIVIGSSHAEPMLRNNVDEWDTKTMGDYNYLTNRKTVYDYWKRRALESKPFENVYTLGMRGIHDSGMEGTLDSRQKIAVLEKIFNDQREIIKTSIASDVTSVPQAFIPYKEVLDIYDNGLKLAEDITIVWPDDNYGYIHRLNNEHERKRKGGSGVYYHISYWGRPHDYLWLSSTHPMLIWEEMTKAHQTQSDRMWIVNVGDIKPMEYNMSLFLDMAYNIQPFSSPDYVKNHLEKWMHDIFGEESAHDLTDISWDYYQLAFERRPEFMGWSQVEPIRVTNFTAYNHFANNDEAQRRIDRYHSLIERINSIKNTVSQSRQDALYELVYYPVRSAQLMSKKFLQNEKAYYYSLQRRASANDFAIEARQAFDSILIETDYYNNRLAAGKWKHMMSMNPRNLPVFECPITPSWNEREGGLGICAEGYEGETPKSNQYGSRLPTFYATNDNAYFVDVFLRGADPVNWQATTSHPWIRLTQSSGKLSPIFGNKEQRIWVSIDWTMVPKGESVNGTIAFKSHEEEFIVDVNTSVVEDQATGFREENGYVSMYAENYTNARNTSDFIWQTVNGLGYTGKAVMITPLRKSSVDKPMELCPELKYDFYSSSKGKAQVNVHCLPVHALNSIHKLRIAISIDGKEPHIIDYRTFDRSETWKQNVMSNAATLSITEEFTNPWKHSLTIQALDPGVVIDRITIDFGGLIAAYSAVRETKVKR